MSSDTCVHRHAAIPDVDRHDERIAEALHRRVEKAVPERRRADHHPVRAQVERRRHRLDRAIAAPGLHRQRTRGAHPLDEAEARHAGEGAVEVDEMEAAGAFPREPPGEIDRVTALERHRVAPASRQSNGSTAEDVDRGDHLEVTC